MSGYMDLELVNLKVYIINMNCIASMITNFTLTPLLSSITSQIRH